MPQKAISDTIANVSTLIGTTTDANVRAELTTVQTDLQNHAQDFEIERNQLIAQNNASLATVATLGGQVASLTADNANKSALIADLQRRAATVATATSAKPIDLANSFKLIVDTIQAQSRQSVGVGTTIKSLDIEIKGIVQVQQDSTPLLVFPTAGSTIDANALSTMRVTFAAVPVVVPTAHEVIRPPG